MSFVSLIEQNELAINMPLCGKCDGMYVVDIVIVENKHCDMLEYMQHHHQQDISLVSDNIVNEKLLPHVLSKWGQHVENRLRKNLDGKILCNHAGTNKESRQLKQKAKGGDVDEATRFVEGLFQVSYGCQWA